MRALPQLNNPKSFSNLKIAVLQPDYSTSGVDYQYYDPKRDLSIILPEASIHHIFLNRSIQCKNFGSILNNLLSFCFLLRGIAQTGRVFFWRINRIYLDFVPLMIKMN